jgi:hypothetical protein
MLSYLGDMPPGAATLYGRTLNDAGHVSAVFTLKSIGTNRQYIHGSFWRDGPCEKADQQHHRTGSAPAPA